jgi:hypothetical protein
VAFGGNLRNGGSTYSADDYSAFWLTDNSTNLGANYIMRPMFSHNAFKSSKAISACLINWHLADDGLRINLLIF